MVTTLITGGLTIVTATAYLEMATQDLRTANARLREVATQNLAEAGLNASMQQLWREFKVGQRFEPFDSMLRDATPSNPTRTWNGVLGTVGNYTASVIGYQQIDSYTRRVTIRSIGWQDRNGNGRLDNGEPRQVMDQTFDLQLSRSGVFDYAYFVTNYGWMYGLDNEQLDVKGDMRAIGDF